MIGASFVKDNSSCLIDEVTVKTAEETDSDSSSVTSSSSSKNEDSSAESESMEIDLNDDDQLDAFMACATSAGKPSGVKPEELSKLWRIDLDSAKRTVNVTSQNCARSENTGFSRNHSSNDRMIRHKRIKECFFMDTFFATSKGGRSSRGHTCVQIFATDKGFVCVVPMKKKGEVLQAIKQFEKEIGVPDAIVCDASGKKTLKKQSPF